MAGRCGLGGFHPRLALRRGAHGRDDGEAAGVLRVVMLGLDRERPSEKDFRRLFCCCGAVWVLKFPAIFNPVIVGLRTDTIQLLGFGKCWVRTWVQ